MKLWYIRIMISLYSVKLWISSRSERKKYESAPHSADWPSPLANRSLIPRHQPLIKRLVEKIADNFIND